MGKPSLGIICCNGLQRFGNGLLKGTARTGCLGPQDSLNLRL